MIYSKIIRESIKNNNPFNKNIIFLFLENFIIKNKDIDQNNIEKWCSVNKYGPENIVVAKKGNDARAAKI